MTEATKHRRRVLIVDDEPSMCELVERVLRDAGYDAQSATSGSDALKIVESQGPFDLVVADVMIPEMTGDELARRLRQIDLDVKVLYLTGFIDKLFERKSSLWADEAFLEKPAGTESLIEAVSLLLFGHITPPA